MDIGKLMAKYQCMTSSKPVVDIQDKLVESGNIHVADALGTYQNELKAILTLLDVPYIHISAQLY